MNVPLSLDRFQRDAIAALNRDASVLVTAPTGAGKTVIADAAIDRALAAGRRAIYTTPLKALSNQKHRDLSHRLGADRVGLLTGDRSMAPRADVVVMTTEIVRALLCARSDLLAGVSVLVLDEFHYLRDPERGSVWEEIVMDAPADLQLVCLSATMPDADRVHRWLADIHPPATLVVEATRPVPLHHIYAVGNLQDEAPLLLPIFNGDQINEVALRHDGARTVTRGEGRRQRDVRRPVTPRRATLLSALADQSLTPAIWFMLSRLGCERAVDELLDAGVTFTDPDRASLAGALAERALARLPAGDQAAIDGHRWRAAFEHGVATHHGGLLPLQREAVELAFAQGLLSVVFATETLAVGVNLPARTAVIDRVTRPESQGGDMVGGDEFAQLAGRAGRRGLDTVGYVVVPWQPDVALYRVAGLAGGTPAVLESQLRCAPTMVASLAGRFSSEEAGREHLERSLFAHLARDQATVLAEEREARLAELALSRAEQEAAQQPEPGLTGTASPSGGANTAGERGLEVLGSLQPGDVIMDPARPVPLLVLARRRGRRGEPAVDVVGTDARRATVGPASFRQPPHRVGRMDLDGWDARVRGQARDAARQLAALERSGRLAVPSPAPAPTNPATGRRRHDGPRHIAKLQRRLDELDMRIATLTTALSDDLAATIVLLQQRGHLRGFELTTSGRLLQRIYHPQALLVAEAYARGCFDGLAPVQLAGVAAAFRAGAGSRSLGRTSTGSGPITERLRAIAELCAAINRDEARLDRPLTLPPDSLFADAMRRWAGGASLAPCLEGIDGLPGDFLREVRQTIELLDQIGACDRGSPLGGIAAEAMVLLDRDAARIGMLETERVS